MLSAESPDCSTQHAQALCDVSLQIMGEKDNRTQQTVRLWRQISTHITTKCLEMMLQIALPLDRQACLMVFPDATTT